MNPGNDRRRQGKKSVTFIKLEKWMDYLGIYQFSFINTFNFPGKPKLEYVDFDRLKNLCGHYDKILALGNFSSDVLKKINIDHYKMPHPSPLNRKLNDTSWEQKMLKECLKYLK